MPGREAHEVRVGRNVAGKHVLAGHYEAQHSAPLNGGAGRHAFEGEVGVEDLTYAAGLVVQQGDDGEFSVHQLTGAVHHLA